MSFYNPQMRTDRLSNAVRPWTSVDALTREPAGRPSYYDTSNFDQREIDACLNCPFPSCEGTARKCRSFRAHYVSGRK